MSAAKIVSPFSGYLEQAKAILARHDQQVVSNAVDAFAQCVELSAVASLPIAQALEDLKQHLKSTQSHAAGRINQLDNVISTYLQQIKPLLKEQQQQITNETLWAISQHVEHSIVQSMPIRAWEQIRKDLSMLQTTNETKAFKKLNTEVAAYKTEVVATLAQRLREIPLDEIANRLGLVLDKHDKHKWWGEGQIININDQKFYDHLNSRVDMAQSI